jgi:hypothetical protein
MTETTEQFLVPSVEVLGLRRARALELLDKIHGHVDDVASMGVEVVVEKLA